MYNQWLIIDLRAILDRAASSQPAEKPVLKEADLAPRTPQSAESTPRRLQKQIDNAIGDHRTSASMINAVIGPNGISTRGKHKSVCCTILAVQYSIQVLTYFHIGHKIKSS